MKSASPRYANNMLEDFPADNPAFWMEFHSLRQETSKFELSLARQLEDFGPDCGTTSKDHYETLKQLVNDRCSGPSTSLTPIEEGGSPFVRRPIPPAPFVEFADALYELNRHRAKLTAAFRNWHESSARLQDEMHNLETKFAEFRHIEGRYKKKVEKYLGLKPGTTDKKLTAMASKIYLRKQLLEIKRLELWTLLRNIRVGQELAILRPFSQVMGAFQELCTEGSKICAPLTEKIAQMEAEVNHDSDLVNVIRESNNEAMKKKGDEFTLHQRTASSFASEVRSDVRSTGIRDVDASTADSTIPKVTATEHQGQLYYPYPAFQPVWVRLKKGKLSIEAEGAANKTVDVLLCTIKEKRDSRMRFVFEVISPSSRFQLQALSAQDLNYWLSVIQNAVSLQLNSQGSASSKIGTETGEFLAIPENDLSHQLEQLRAIPGNDQCADCQSDKPEWLSINLGIMVCLTCSGVHRSLGTHISKVRSANLDKIDLSMMAFLEAIGNTNANAMWEGKIVSRLGGVKRPQIAGSDKAIRNMWISSKYAIKQYVIPPEFAESDPQYCYSCKKQGYKVDPLFEMLDEAKLQTVRECLGNVECKKKNQQVEINLRLFDAIRRGCALDAMKCLIWGADVNAHIGFTKGDNPECFDGKTALHHVASDAENPSRLVLAEMIIANSANSQSRDCRGWTALHYAAYNQDVAMVELLLNRGGKNLISLVDRDAKRPRTALRVAMLTDDNPAIPLLLAAEQEYNRKEEKKTAAA